MSPSSKHPQPKRYYKRLSRFPEGIDRLESEVRLPVDGEQIGRWVDELFLGGGMKAMVGYMILKYGAWEEAMNLSANTICNSGGVKYAPPSPQTTGFRAAWALEWAYEQSEPGDLPEWFFDRLADDFTASSNGSLHRIYAKIICDMMRFGSVRPTDNQAERLAEKCFDLVFAYSTKGAAKFWCLEILSDLSTRMDWVAEELPETLRRISAAPDCTPGLRVATREILKRLHT